jgi:hypothetical protein
MIDMLARGGYLEEARKMANTYKTFDATIKSSEAVFGAYYSHGDVDMGLELGGKLIMLEPEREMSYVMLSNLYCASEKWKEAEGATRVSTSLSFSVVLEPTASLLHDTNMVST